MPLPSSRWLARRARPKRTNPRHAGVMLAAATVLVAVTITGAGRPPEPAYSAVDPALVDVGDPAVTQPLIPGSIQVPLAPATGALLGFDDLFGGFSASVPTEVEAEARDGEVCVSSPLNPGSYRITSKYGMRSNPFSGRYMLHAGTDMAAPFGTPIHAVADGTVSYTGPGRSGRSSELVIIDHEIDGKKFSSWYVHMYPDGVFVKAGQEVRSGEVIAEVGSNGNSTGPHLHLEIHALPPVAKGKGMSFAPRLQTAPAPADTTPAPEGTAPEATTPDPSATGEETSSAPSPSATDPTDPSETPTDGESTENPTDEPSETPTDGESPDPTDEPSETPTDPGETPTGGDPSPSPSESPSESPSPSETPSSSPSPSESTSPSPSESATEDPSDEPSEDPSDDPSEEPTEESGPRSTGYFDPATGGYTTDPLAFLAALGYEISAPSVCLR